MVKIVKKNPGNGRLNNLNDPVLNVLILYLRQSLACYLTTLSVTETTQV